MTALAELLAAEFVDGEVLQFTGRGGRTFDYIEDETGMDRLAETLGGGSWSVPVEPISVAEGIVKVRLSGTTPDGKTFAHEDFGYQTRDGGEALKEAVSDGIRRCGRYLGIGRYLYRKHDSPGAHGTSSPVRTVAAAARPAAATNPYGQPKSHDDPYPDDLSDLDAGPPSAGTCPVHGVEFRLVPAGTSKRTGKPYDAFWSCPEMGCKERPR